MPFTRANIYARDGYTCQYCGVEFDGEDLTFDHVVPVVAGMTLLRTARKPKPSPLLRIGVGLKKAPASWRDFLYWNVALED